ncbi:TonB-dependent receptor domain-containing protein [Hymenobacter endophyticus]|uniref:TonB-dependent receptor n=1 Tax=Hymenobacter endophyticus TaxID=3076335 RepID=A0ABU3TDS9_9BACT|nr:TonB-dependent receptor [Hymenobacter endophyticus]MDU0369535.1 TonB-dependent receptor [Hymenobacter endophyticus]
MRRSFLLLFFLTISHLIWAQQGTLVGKVTDKKTGEGAIGATVLVTGTTQAAPVEIDGSYALKLAAGTYNITIQSIGYKPLTFSGISIQADQKTTLNGALEENAQALKEVVVTGQKQTGTEVAMIQDLKKSEVVVSGMSNDQIVKTLDRDAAEVVKRIPGVTIQNNNFIVIRGLAERYNTVMLNGTLTPSAEVDTRSFSFDILPSSVIDRVLIFKSGSPELPGEFGGGVVQVYTKNSVLDNSGSFTASGWARSTTTFKGGYQESSHSSTDWLGYDSGQRELPGSVPAYQNGQVLTGEALKPAGTALRSEWTPTLTTARPDLRLSLGLNRRFEVGTTYLSNVTSLSYSNTREQYDVERNRYEAYVPGTNSAPAARLYNDRRATTSARLGIIHNWQARINDHNRLEFRNFLNQYGTDEVVNRTGIDYSQGGPGEGILRDNAALHYQSRTIYSGQLAGTHDLGPNLASTLTWTGGYNYVFRDEPDYRRFRTEQPEDMSQPRRLGISNNPNQYDASRYYSDLKENTYTGNGQWEQRFSGRDTTKANQYKLRVGFYAEQKQRDYNSRFFSYIRNTEGGVNFDRSIQLLSPDEAFSPANLRPGGLKLEEGTQPQDRYTGKNTLLAGYVSAVAPISDAFSVSGGVRVEYNRRTLMPGNGQDYKEVRVIPMPSFNATYNFNQRSLVRLGGSVSVNRPEFREIANYTYYDFTNDLYIRGNDSLKTATIYNGDLRYEFYPTRSEMLSVGVFYKYFRDPIEQTTQSVPGSDLYLTYQNAEQAYDVGVEVEARKSLVGLTESRFLQRFSLILNASLIRSRVKLVENQSNTGFALSDRPLQGQSPYVVNTGLFYQDDENRWQVSAQYNVIGPRITFVGDRSQNYSVFELPRHVVDLALTKGFGKHFDLRLGIQDVLNQYVRQYYDFNRDGKINSGENGSFARYRRGTYSTAGLTYKF